MSHSSMDDQYKQMQMFHNELREFNHRLMSSWFDMKEHHERVDPLWQDEMRRGYDTSWEPLEEQMEHYLRVQANNYMEFLELKLEALRRYLFGG